jgi:hypothetical protein
MKIPLFVKRYEGTDPGPYEYFAFPNVDKPSLPVFSVSLVELLYQLQAKEKVQS